MISRFNHHLLCGKKVVIKFARHLSETFFNHHLLITMGPCLNPMIEHLDVWPGWSLKASKVSACQA